VRAHVRAHPGSIFDLQHYDELYMRSWWGFTRVAGYVLPLAIWPLFFRRDSVLDFGLRGRGFRAHAWIYALCVVVMIPVLVIVSMQPDFADYYPMYKQAGRSWLDFAIWEIVYLAQFFTLELFFRGFILRALRSCAFLDTPQTECYKTTAFLPPPDAFSLHSHCHLHRHRDRLRVVHAGGVWAHQLEAVQQGQARTL